MTIEDLIKEFELILKLTESLKVEILSISIKMPEGELLRFEGSTKEQVIG